jgi:hypothetical protein
MQGIDRDRGCTIRFHPSGFRVIMYDDAPGEYLSEKGDPMPESVAAKAGFDIEGLAKERRKLQRLAEYKAKVEEEFATEESDVEALLSVPGSGLEVKHIGAGKYAIMDEDGQRLTQKPLTRQEAETLINDLKAGGSDDGEAS